MSKSDSDDYLASVVISYWLKEGKGGTGKTKEFSCTGGWEKFKLTEFLGAVLTGLGSIGGGGVV